MMQPTVADTFRSATKSTQAKNLSIVELCKRPISLSPDIQSRALNFWVGSKDYQGMVGHKS